MKKRPLHSAPPSRTVPLSRPDFGPEALKRVREVLDDGWVTQGPRVEAFERAFAAKTGARHAVAVTSATTGLHLVMACLGIGRGDEVIVPGFTFVATANAVIHAGARPVLADVSPRDYNMTPADAKRRITRRTRAILLVHQFGHPADLAGFRRLCREEDILLIEDAACAIGSLWKNRPIGDGSAPAVFSLHPRKVITTGEGGMIVTNDDELAARLRSARFHGAMASTQWKKPFETGVGEVFAMAGWNYKMTDIQAAIGLEQLEHLEEFVERRRHLAGRYDLAFRRIKGVTVARDRRGAMGNGQSYYILLPDHPTRERVHKWLTKNHVMTRRGMQSLNALPYLCARFGSVILERAEQISARGIFLPLYPGLKERDQNRVVELVRESISPRFSIA